MLQGNKKAAWSCQAAYNLDRIGVMNRLGSIQHHSATNERGNVQILAVIDGSGDFWLYNAAVGPTLVVRQDGKVGIGTTTPQAKLEVAGNVRATAFLGDSSGFDRDQRRQSLFARGIRTIVRHHSGPGNGLDQTWHLSRRQPGSPADEADEVDGTRERQEVVIIYGGVLDGAP